MEGQGTTSAFHGFGPNLAAVEFDERFSNRPAAAWRFYRCLALGLRPVVGLEYPGKFILGNSTVGVLYRDR